MTESPTATTEKTTTTTKRSTRSTTTKIETVWVVQKKLKGNLQVIGVYSEASLKEKYPQLTEANNFSDCDGNGNGLMACNHAIS